MAINAGILPAHELLVHRLHGRLGTDEVCARLAADPEFVWRWDRLVSFDDDVDLSGLELASLAAIKEQMIRSYFGGREPPACERPAYRVAVVCRNPANTGLVSLFRSLWAVDQSPVIDIRIFDTADEALTWLGHEPISEEALRAEMQFL